MLWDEPKYLNPQLQKSLFCVKRLALFGLFLLIGQNVFVVLLRIERPDTYTHMSDAERSSSKNIGY